MSCLQFAFFSPSANVECFPHLWFYPALFLRSLGYCQWEFSYSSFTIALWEDLGWGGGWLAKGHSLTLMAEWRFELGPLQSQPNSLPQMAFYPLTILNIWSEFRIFWVGFCKCRKTSSSSPSPFSSHMPPNLLPVVLQPFIMLNITLYTRSLNLRRHCPNLPQIHTHNCDLVRRKLPSWEKRFIFFTDGIWITL